VGAGDEGGSRMNTTVAAFLGLCLLAVLVVLIAGMALCSHFDADYFDGSDDPHV
jgi:hypothetical protein